MSASAVEFLLHTLANGPKTIEQLRRKAESLDLDMALTDAARRLNISRDSGSKLLRLNEAACIVCGGGTSHLETVWTLPLCPSCPSPIQTWVYKQPRTDGKRGSESLTVGHRADCWRSGFNELTLRPGTTLVASMDTCASVMTRMWAGRSFCDGNVVWKVRRRRGTSNTTYSSVWCDEDLPADVRMAIGKAAA